MDELQRSLLNVFTYSDLDRHVKQRKQKSWLHSLQSAASSRFVVSHQQRFLFHTEPKLKPYYIKGSKFHDLCRASDTIVFLGSRKNHHYFVADLARSNLATSLTKASTKFIDLRSAGRDLKANQSSLLSYAKSMIHWHDAHQHCGVCGNPTHPQQGGHVRQCIIQDCARVQFPRTDPAIIVSVIHDGRCLFGRQATWPESRYSVIAGFVEPGESVEQAVVREVHEETNIKLHRIRYHSSQPWPFPGSIMLGYSATASSNEITLNDGELQDAHWRSTDEVIDGLASGDFRLPPPLSIAYRLIEDWFNAHNRHQQTLANAMQQLNVGHSW